MISPNTPIGWCRSLLYGALHISQQRSCTAGCFAWSSHTHLCFQLLSWCLYVVTLCEYFFTKNYNFGVHIALFEDVWSECLYRTSGRASVNFPRRALAGHGTNQIWFDDLIWFDLKFYEKWLDLIWKKMRIKMIWFDLKKRESKRFDFGHFVSD